MYTFLKKKKKGINVHHFALLQKNRGESCDSRHLQRINILQS